MKHIDKIVKYTDTETVRKHIKYSKLNKEFTQSSWATSLGPAFNGGLSIMSYKVEFYNSELNSSLTQ